MSNPRFLRAVQFLHGGTQPPYFEGTPAWYSRVSDVLPPATGYTPWNTSADHHRKFMNANARLVRSVGARPERSAIGFWGEWEPPSLADPVAEYVRHGARHIHHPVFAYDNNEWNRLIGPSSSGNCDCMNTDPFVFGCEFYYVCCHQEAFPAMRNLERGSVILFGSRRSHEFVLDTVFVVADYLRWPEDRELIERRTPTIYHRVTLDYLNPDPLPGREEPVKLYIGATFERPVHGMFSYVPCLTRLEAPDGFVRPTIEYTNALPFISPDKTQGISTRLLVDLDEARNTWNAVADVVTRAGLCLGFEMEMPVDATIHQQGSGAN